MLYWIRFPLIRFLVFFVIGILFSRVTDFASHWSILIFYLFLSLYFILLLFLKKEKFIRYNFLIGINAFLLLALSGAVISSSHDHRHDADQLVNSVEKIRGYLAWTEEVNSDDSSYVRMTVAIRQVKIKREWKHKGGRIILTIKRSAMASKSYHPGNLLLIKGAPAIISAPENPDQFDYRKYMYDKGIYLQHFITSDQCILIGEGHRFNIRKIASNLREHCRSFLFRHIPDHESFALVSALTLGLKDELSDEMTSDYAKAGISHILAVSGLHVGIFYIILFVIFKPFNRNKTTAWVISGIIVSILIIFAFITGLSASVLRSVILFTFIETGRRLGRKSISFNTLAASALFLLIINPNYIYMAGFQLSYLAVTGIIFFQPHLYKMIIFTNDAADYVWKLVTVAIAAQITTFPVTLYYFHTFPAYFMISNIIAIPSAFLILTFGLGIIGLHFISLIADLAGLMVSWVIHYFNWSVHSLSSLPGSQVTGIRFNLPMVFLFYGIIFMVMMLITERKTRYIYGIIISIFILAVTDLAQFISTSSREKIIFYSAYSGPLIELVTGHEGILIADSAILGQPGSVNKIISNHCISDRHPCQNLLFPRSEISLPVFTGPGYKLFTWKGKSILIANDTRPLRALSFPRPVKIDFLILTGNAGFGIENLKDHFNPGTWIIDRSSRPASRENAEKILTVMKEPFISIAKTGAYSRRLNQPVKRPE